MAWLSVHESIDGPKLRRLHKELNCSKFEATGLLVFLWLWGLTNADITGKIRDADKEDIERQLYGVGTGCSIDMKKAVDALIRTGWIDVNPDGLYLHDWDSWQAQWYKAIERRNNDNERKREQREARKALREQAARQSEQANLLTKGDSMEVPPDIPLDVPLEVPKEHPEESLPDATPAPITSPEKSSTPYSVAFEEFWSAYPRKDDKGTAYRKYKTRIKDGFSESQLLSAAKRYAMQCKRQNTEKQYIKQAKTFLSDTLPFLDFLPKPKTEPAPDNPNGNPFAEYGGGG